MTQSDAGSSQQPKNLRGTISVLTRLAPKQLNDEFSLTVRQLQSKGISLGISVALVVVGLVFLGFVAIALVVAAIAGLATVMPLWLSALLIALLFLLIAGALAGIGAMRAKAAIPEAIEVPKLAMRRVKHDLGVLSEGTAFDPSTLSAPKKPKESDSKKNGAKSESAEEETPVQKPTEAELRRRLARRREHLAQLRDTLGEQTDVKAKMGQFVGKVSDATGRAKSGVDRAQVGLSDAVANQTQLRATAEKVGPWVVVSLAGTAAFVFLRRVFRRQK